jgi:hypothetical protein
MGNSRLCAVCRTPLPAPVRAGKPSPYCCARHRDAAQRHRHEIRYWERLLSGWQMSADAWPDDPQVRQTVAWCQVRLDRARSLPDSFFIPRHAHWALRTSESDARLEALMKKAGYQVLDLYATTREKGTA